MAYQDPQATVEPYDFDAEMQRLLYGGQAPTASDPIDGQSDPTKTERTPATVEAPDTGVQTAQAMSTSTATPRLPAQPGTGSTNASAYSNPGYSAPGIPENDQRGETGGGTGQPGGGSAGGGDTGTTPPPTDEGSLTTRRNAVLKFYRDYWGRDAALWEQDYWAKQQNLSLSDIENTLRNAPEATNRGGGTSSQTFDKNTDFGAPGIIEAYYKSRGKDPFAGSADYWRKQWNDWGKSDPEYFLKRLAAADEFTGVGPGYDWTNGGGTEKPTPPAADPRISDAIDKLLKRGQTLPTGDDPELRAQFNPTAEIMQRNADRTRANASERAFAQGQYGQSATNVANSQIDQAVGLDQAQLMGELVKTELAARRQDVVNALTFAEGQQKIALTQYLGQLDAALRQQGLNNQDRQYYFGLNADIAQREALLQQYLYNMLLGGGQ